MADFEKMYFHLFNAVTDAIEHARAGRSEEVRDRLMKAQQECEEMYVSDDSSTMTAGGVLRP